MNLQQKIQRMMVDFEKEFDQLALKCYARHRKSCRVTRNDMRIIDQQINGRIVREIQCTKCNLGDTQYVELNNIG